jgi:Intrinsic membrane protein PufX
MADKAYFDESDGARLRSWALSQMMRGAGYAAVFLISIGLFLYALYGVSLLLPPESKEAPTPNLSRYEAPDAHAFV